MGAFEEGYEFAVRQTGGSYAAVRGSNYVREVEGSIQELYRRMNAYDYYKATRPAQESLKGFIAEEFAAGTANVDAVVKGSRERFVVLKSHELGSIDVVSGSGSGAAYQLKMYENPYKTVCALGTTLLDRYQHSSKGTSMSFEDWAASVGRAGAKPGDLLYEGQFGVVAGDNLEACRNEAFRLLAKNRALGKDSEVARWQKVSDLLTDRVRGEEGVEGRPLSIEEARRMAIDVTSGRKLDPSDHGMTTAEVIKIQNALAQSLKAGVSAAAMSAAMKVAPEIYRAIDCLIAEGKLDEDSVRAIGAATLEGSATGFVSGTATAAITSAACRGALGKTIMGAMSKPMGPVAMGALVVLTLEACKDAFLVARGEKTGGELVNNFVQGTFASVVALVGAGIASIVTGGAAVPVLVGSFVGSAAGGLAFSPVKSCVLRVASESGFTFFGLVQQDYVLPERTVCELGVQRAQFEVASVATAQPSLLGAQCAQVKLAPMHSIGISYNERGMIGVNKIGYIPR